MLRIWFLNVGHGDCTVIQHPSGRITMIDINASCEYDKDSLDEFIKEYFSKQDGLRIDRGLLSNGPGINRGLLGYSSGLGINRGLLEYGAALLEAKREITDPVSFMKATFPGTSVFRFILTHPDMDHMRGLKRLYNEVGFTNFWDTGNNKTITDFNGGSDKEDWEFYQAVRRGAVNVTYLRYFRGADAFAFGSPTFDNPNGDGIEVLSPSPFLVEYANNTEAWNDLSYVLRVRFGQHSILLPGDAETMAWTDMRLAYNRGLKSSTLKASHHGRDSGYDLDAIQIIAPSTTIVSVGRKPETDASSKYKYHGHRVWSTRHYGDLKLTIDDQGNCDWRAQRNGSSNA